MAVVIACAPVFVAGQARATRSPGAGPVIVFETAKGTFEVETYPNEAPKTVGGGRGRGKKKI
jgi:hypothetical protein